MGTIGGRSILGIGIASSKAGFEPLRGAAGTVGAHDGRADGDPSGSRFEDAIEIVFIDSANGEPRQAPSSQLARPTKVKPASSGSAKSLVGLEKTGPTPK